MLTLKGFFSGYFFRSGYQPSTVGLQFFDFAKRCNALCCLVPRPRYSVTARRFRVTWSEVKASPASSGIRHKLTKAAFTRQTKVGKLKLACVNGIKTVGKYVGKQLAANRTCLYSRQLFHQLFYVGKLVFDV